MNGLTKCSNATLFSMNDRSLIENLAGCDRSTGISFFRSANKLQDNAVYFSFCNLHFPWTLIIQITDQTIAPTVITAKNEIQTNEVFSLTTLILYIFIPIYSYLFDYSQLFRTIYVTI